MKHNNNPCYIAYVAKNHEVHTCTLDLNHEGEHVCTIHNMDVIKKKVTKSHAPTRRTKK